MHHFRATLLVLVSGTASAQFGPELIAYDSDLDYPTCLALADLDNDGDLDMVVGDSERTLVMWNDGGGTFSEGPVVGVGMASILRVADVNGDGYADILSGGSGFGGVYGFGPYLNNGNGNFIAGTTISTSLTKSYGLAVADLDGDGDLDLASRAPNNLRVFWNDGTGVYTPGSTLSTNSSSGMAQVVAFDADGDSDNDLAVLGNVVQAGLYVNLGGGSFAAATPITGAGTSYLSTVWDKEGDGDLDLFMGGPRWLMNDGSGTFTNGDTLSTGGVTGVAGDPDQDGDPDLFYGNTTDLNVRELRNEGTTVTALVIETVQAYSLLGVTCALGDINGDGQLDLAMCNGSSMLGWYAGDGDNGWSLRHTVGQVLTWPSEALAADMDLDGDLDLVALGSRDDRIAWYPNDGTGTLVAQQPMADNMDNPADVDIFDIDQDGDSDVVLYNKNAGTVVRLRNMGMGLFVADTLAVQAGPIAHGHLNADPYPDLVCGDAWYLNDGNGGFLFQVDLGLSITSGVACGDMDGDGLDDIVLAAGQVVVITAINGVNHSQSTTSGDPWRVELADLDVDGDLDVVCMNPGTSQKWFANDGSGQLGAAQFWATGLPDSPIAMVLRDLTGDGAPDIVWSYSNGYTHRMYYVLNNGNGTMGPNTLAADANRGYTAPGLADLDGDLVEDLFCANADGTITLQQNHFHNAFRLRGSVFLNFDQNGVLDATDLKVPYRLVRTDANNVLVWTNGLGDHDLPADTGTWHLWHTPSAIYDVTNTPDTLEATLTTMDPIAEHLDIGLAPALDDTATFLTITPINPRCNTTSSLQMVLRNTGTFIPENIVVHVTIVSGLMINGVFPTPTLQQGNDLYWSINSLGWFQAWYAWVDVTTGNAGEIADYGYEITADGLPDPILMPHLGFTILCAFDPNDKQVQPAGHGMAGAIPVDTDWLDYTVRFQNTGTDTAITVTILDTLDLDLDETSMEVLDASHPLTHIQVDADRVAMFRFASIMLPDSNANEPASHGFVRYRMRPVAGAPHGTTITNGAAILFDWNEPVLTNTVLNTLVDCDLHVATINDLGSTLEASQGWSYQWFLNGDTLTADTLQQLEPQANGDYTVAVTSEFGCVDISDPYTYLTTGIDRNTGPFLMVVPNPSRGDLLLFGAPLLDGTARIDLLDASGRVLRSWRGNGAMTMRLDAQDIADGTYLLHLQDTESVRAVRVVIARP